MTPDQKEAFCRLSSILAAHDGHVAAKGERSGPFWSEMLVGAADLRAILDALAANQPAPAIPFDQKAQGLRCSCRGTDDWCVCQNVPDRETLKAHRGEPEPAADTGTRYECREIGEGGWRPCSKAEYDHFSKDPNHDTRIAGDDE